MAESNAISAQGTIIKLNGTPIGELRDITPPELSRKNIETTNHNSDDDSYVVGIRRKGDLTFEVGFVHDVHEALLDSFDAGSKELFEIDFPDGATWLFSGFVSKIGPKQPVDNGQTASVSVRPSGGHIITIPS